MRRLLLVGLVITLAACHRPRKVDGQHPAIGISDEEAQVGTRVFVCDPYTERCKHGTIREVTDASTLGVAYYDKDYAHEVARARVFPASRLQIGGVIEDIRTNDWHVVSYVDDKSVGADGTTYEIEDIMVPTDRAEALDRHDRWMMTIIGVLSTIMSILFLRGARRLQVKAQHHAWVAEHGSENGPKNPEPKRRKGQALPGVVGRDPTQLAALTCKSCGAPVMLVASEQTECASCKAPVEIPADYVSLVRSREEIAKNLPAEAAVLRRARVLGHPAFGLVIIASAYGIWKLYGVIAGLVLAASMQSAAGVTGFIVTFPLLFAPIAVFITGIGMLSGGAKLRGKTPALAAVKDDKGYACRGCGAALAATTDGVAELCLYCGTQNLISAKLAASASKASATARLLDLSIRTASSAFWSRFDGIWVPVLYTVGFVGIVLNPIIVWVGLTT